MGIVGYSPVVSWLLIGIQAHPNITGLVIYHIYPTRLPQLLLKPQLVGGFNPSEKY
jgi:hypothetical protein